MSTGGGVLPKTKSSRSSLEQLRDDLNVQSSNSELFELKAKPKLFCIPENCRRIFDDLRKTQSLDINKKVEHPEKSWSVLFVGPRGLDMASSSIVL